MLETSLSKPPVRSCRNCSLRPARLNQRQSWKTATRDVREALASSKCPPRKKAQPPLLNSMARKLMVAPSTSTKPNRARIAAAVVVVTAVAVVVAAATAVIAAVVDATSEVATTGRRAGNQLPVTLYQERSRQP